MSLPKNGLFIFFALAAYTLTFCFSTVQISIGKGFKQNDTCDRPNGVYLVSLKSWLFIQGVVNCSVVISFLLVIAVYRLVDARKLVMVSVGILSAYGLWLCGWVTVGFVQIFKYSTSCNQQDHALYQFTLASAIVGIVLIIVNAFIVSVVVQFGFDHPDWVYIGDGDKSAVAYEDEEAPPPRRSRHVQGTSVVRTSAPPSSERTSLLR